MAGQVHEQELQPAQQQEQEQEQVPEDDGRGSEDDLNADADDDVEDDVAALGDLRLDGAVLQQQHDMLAQIGLAHDQLRRVQELIRLQQLTIAQAVLDTLPDTSPDAAQQEEGEAGEPEPEEEDLPEGGDTVTKRLLEEAERPVFDAGSTARVTARGMWFMLASWRIDYSIGDNAFEGLLKILDIAFPHGHRMPTSRALFRAVLRVRSHRADLYYSCARELHWCRPGDVQPGDECLCGVPWCYGNKPAGKVNLCLSPVSRSRLLSIVAIICCSRHPRTHVCARAQWLVYCAHRQPALPRQCPGVLGARPRGDRAGAVC